MRSLTVCTLRNLTSLPQKPLVTVPKCCHTGTPTSGALTTSICPCTAYCPGASAPALLGSYSLLTAWADFQQLHPWPLTLLGVLSPVKPLTCLTYTGDWRERQGQPWSREPRAQISMIPTPPPVSSTIPILLPVSSMIISPPSLVQGIINFWSCSISGSHQAHINKPVL